MRQLKGTLIVLLPLFMITGCIMHVDKPVHVEKGDIARSIYVVDGAITLEPHSRARKLRAVDGSITLGAASRVAEIHTVDGSITMDSGASCEGDVNSVSGTTLLQSDATIGGDVLSLTGHVDANDAKIHGHIETVSGHVLLSEGTQIDGGIILALPSSKTNETAQKRLPVVVIGAGVVVAGPIVAYRGGTLLVNRSAKIGAVKGLSIQWFKGTKPPIEY